MASRELEPTTGVWGRRPHRGIGAEPLLGLITSNGFSEAPLKLKAFCSFHTIEGPKDTDLNETI